jgi:hypothetical protein
MLRPGFSRCDASAKHWWRLAVTIALPGGVLRVAATSVDGGKTWEGAEQQPGGFRSGVEVVDGKTWIAVGTSGEDISTDRGMHWRHSGSLNLNAVVALNDGTVFAVGPKGTVARKDK